MLFLASACAEASGTGAQPTATATEGSTVPAPPTSAEPSVTTTNGPRPTTTSPRASRAPTPTGLTVTSAGGFAGLRRQIEIAADGSWTFTDLRNGTSQRGQLSAAQRKELARLVSDPALVREARTPAAPGACADAFVYTIVTGELSFRYEQCAGVTKRPRTDQVLELVLSATPM
jgi:hypothetical protein